MDNIFLLFENWYQNNKEDWKKIEEYIDNRNSEMLSKYKIDINQDIGKRIEQSKKNKKIIKKIIVIAIIILIYSAVYSIYNIWASRARKERLQSFLGIVTETNVKTNLFGNGCYSYEIVSIPDAEIHVEFDIFRDIFIEDSDERLCKYYFEKWEDKGNHLNKKYGWYEASGLRFNVDTIRSQPYLSIIE